MLKIDTKFELPDSWLKTHSDHAPFSHSFDWEEILSKEGKYVERLMILDDNQPVAMAFIEYKDLFFGLRYAFCSKGPIFIDHIKQDSKKVSDIFDIITRHLKNKKCIFFKFESDILPALNKVYLKKVSDFNPRATLALDLHKIPDDILKQMHSKTRYNIRLANKKELVIGDQKDANLFMTLMRKTAQRDGFRLHPDMHYHQIIFSPLSYQLTVFKGQRPIAVALFIGFGNTFTYLFGASDYEYRASMAPYFLQWEGIKLGQRYGYHYYDFFGIAPLTKDQNEGVYKYDNKHQYAGVTRFKLGFNGDYYEKIGTYDFIISSCYYRLYRLLKFIKNIF